MSDYVQHVQHVQLKPGLTVKIFKLPGGSALSRFAHTSAGISPVKSFSKSKSKVANSKEGNEVKLICSKRRCTISVRNNLKI